MTDECCSSGCSCGCSSITPDKMCQLSQPAHKFDVEKVKRLTSDPKFLCECCGRTANNKENLCSPTPLN